MDCFSYCCQPNQINSCVITKICSFFMSQIIMFWWIPRRSYKILLFCSSSVMLVVFKGNYKLHCSCSSVLVPSNLLFAFMLNMFLIGKFLILLNFMHTFVEKRLATTILSILPLYYLVKARCKQLVLDQMILHLSPLIIQEPC